MYFSSFFSGKSFESVIDNLITLHMDATGDKPDYLVINKYKLPESLSDKNTGDEFEMSTINGRIKIIIK